MGKPFVSFRPRLFLPNSVTEFNFMRRRDLIEARLGWFFVAKTAADKGQFLSRFSVSKKRFCWLTAQIA
jgi:hypothetical protein